MGGTLDALPNLGRSLYPKKLLRVRFTVIKHSDLGVEDTMAKMVKSRIRGHMRGIESPPYSKITHVGCRLFIVGEKCERWDKCLVSLKGDYEIKGARFRLLCKAIR